MENRVYPALSEEAVWEQLENGLTVAVVPKPGFDRRIAYFVTDYGAIHTRFCADGQERTAPAGVAHYLEHKLFDMPGRDITAEFAALGAVPNAFTSYDMTAYYFSCTQHFYENLRLLLEFVTTGYFTEESVQKEQGIIGQEIDMNEDAPDTRVFENLMKAMYREHPIRVPILGTRQSIAEITPQVLRDCHEAFYSPANMLLCVVGDADPEQVCAIARQMTEKMPCHKAQRQSHWQEDMTCPQALVTDRMEVAMPMFQLGFKSEPLQNGEAAVRQEAVGDLAAEALFGESSPLYLQLYEEGLIDSSFGGGFETVDGMSMLTCSGDSDDPEAIRDAILARAESLVREGVAQEDFMRMKRSALGRRIRDLDSFDSTAFRVCAYYFSGFDYFRFPEVYRQVERQEILDFIKTVVTPQRCSLSVILPYEEANA